MVFFKETLVKNYFQFLNEFIKLPNIFSQIIEICKIIDDIQIIKFFLLLHIR